MKIDTKYYYSSCCAALTNDDNSVLSGRCNVCHEFCTFDDAFADEQIADRRHSQQLYDGPSKRFDTALAAHITNLSNISRQSRNAATEAQDAAGKAKDALAGLMLSLVGIIFLLALLA